MQEKYYKKNDRMNMRCW